MSDLPAASALTATEPKLPAEAELCVLGRTERAGFWLTHQMNRGSWKRLMTFGQRHLGSLWIYLATYNLMNVFGIEHVEGGFLGDENVAGPFHQHLQGCVPARLRGPDCRIFGQFPNDRLFLPPRAG